MKAKTGHLANRGWLNLKPINKDRLKQCAQKREGQRRAVDVDAPVLDWKKLDAK